MEFAVEAQKLLSVGLQGSVGRDVKSDFIMKDVKCTHGATIGQLSEAAIFNLRSRGIPSEKARRMLIHAFAGEIIDRVRCPAVREELERGLARRLEADNAFARERT